MGPFLIEWRVVSEIRKISDHPDRSSRRERHFPQEIPTCKPGPATKAWIPTGCELAQTLLAANPRLPST